MMKILRKLKNLFHREISGEIYATVGDVCSKIALSKGFRPKVIIYDGKTKNKPFEMKIPRIYERVEFKSFKGVYSERFDRLMKRVCQERGYFAVLTGNDDNAIYAVLQYSPIGSVVLEGLITHVVSKSLQSHGRRKKKYGKCYVGTDLFKRFESRYRRGGRG